MACFQTVLQRINWHFKDAAALGLTMTAWQQGSIKLNLLKTFSPWTKGANDLCLFQVDDWKNATQCWLYIDSHSYTRCLWYLTHCGRVTHICVSKLTIISSDNGLSPGQRHAILWTNAGILLSGPFATSFSEILIEIHKFSFKKIYLKMSSGKLRPFCLGLNMLRKL